MHPAQVDLWAGASDWKHPMEHYTLRAREAFTEDRGKCMVDPNHMAGFNVSASASCAMLLLLLLPWVAACADGSSCNSSRCPTGPTRRHGTT